MSLITFSGKKCFNKVTKVYFGCFFVKLTVVYAQSCHNNENNMSDSNTECLTFT